MEVLPLRPRQCKGKGDMENYVVDVVVAAVDKGRLWRISVPLKVYIIEEVYIIFGGHL